MLKHITIIASAMLFSLGARHRLSPNEQKVVGTWKRLAGSVPQRIFRSDHTSETLFPRKGGKRVLMTKGRWGLEGDNILVHISTIRSRQAPRTFKGRTPVIEFRPDRLVMEILEQGLFRVQ